MLSYARHPMLNRATISVETSCEPLESQVLRGKRDGQQTDLGGKLWP